MLAPLKQPEEPEYGSDSPTVMCECCGKSGPSHLMINLMIAIGSPGHPSISGFQCPGSGQVHRSPEHWACSPDCWKEIAHACINEHMHDLLLQAHQKVGL